MDNDDNDNNIRSHTFHVQLSPHNYIGIAQEPFGSFLKQFLFTRRSYFTRQQILITHPIFSVLLFTFFSFLLQIAFTTEDSKNLFAFFPEYFYNIVFVHVLRFLFWITTQLFKNVIFHLLFFITKYKAVVLGRKFK